MENQGRCELCDTNLDCCNLSLNKKKLCSECCWVDDINRYCVEDVVEPTIQTDEIINGNIKRTKKVYQIDNDTTVEICSDEDYNLNNELQRENQELRERLDRLEQLINSHGII